MKNALILFLCGSATVVQGATVTSAQAGPWSSTSTWAGGTIPGNGDSAILVHTVTVGANTIIGSSPAAGGTAAITINNGGQLTCASPGIELTVRGDIKYANPTAPRNVIDFTSSCTLTMDPTQSASPTATSYKIGPSATNGTNALLNFVGVSNTPGNRVIVRTLRTNGNEAQAAFSQNGFTTQLNRMNAQYFQFIDLGNASTPAVLAYAPSLFRLQDGVVTRCGLISTDAVSLAATAVHHIENVVFESSPGKNIYSGSSVALTTGTRLVKNNYFDAPYSSGMGTLNWTYSGNVFAVSPIVYFAGVTTLVDNNLFIHAGSGNIGCNGGTFSNNYFLNPNGAANGKFCQVTLTAADTTFLDNTAEIVMNAGAGDLFMDTRALGSAKTTAMIGTIALPVSDVSFPTAGGTLFNATGTNTPNIVLENNTSPGGNSNVNTTGSGDCMNYAVAASESASNRTGTFTSYKGNLHWNGATARGHHGCTQWNPLNDNILAAVNAIYNDCHNCLPVNLWPGKDNQGTFYWFPMTGGTAPGAGDVNENPALAEPTRNAAGWAAWRGLAPANHTGILAFLALPSTDRAAEIRSLSNWVRQGFAPRNIRLAVPSAPRGRIGAVPPILMFGPINQ